MGDKRYEQSQSLLEHKAVTTQKISLTAPILIDKAPDVRVSIPTLTVAALVNSSDVKNDNEFIRMSLAD